MTDTHKLPSGKITKSVKRYRREWLRLSRVAARALGCDVIGFDPGIHLIPKDAQRGFQLTPQVALRIAELVKQTTWKPLKALPSFAEAYAAIDKTPTALQQFIYHHEPVSQDEAEKFRSELLAAINATRVSNA